MNVSNRDAVLAALTPVFREVMDDPELVVDEHLTGNDVPMWDSLNHIALIVEVEAQTGLVFTTDQLVGLSNVGDFVSLLIEMGFEGHP